MKRFLFVFLFINISLFSQQKSTGEIFLIGEVSTIITLDNDLQTAFITLSGPDDRWFAVKYGSFTNGMQTGPDVLYYDGTTLIDASQLGSGPVDDDIQNIEIISNTVSNGIRTFVVSRPFENSDSNDFNFSFADSSIDLAGAHGSFENSYALSYHGPNRGIQTNRSFQTLGVENFASVKQVIIYPNPVSDILSIDMNEHFEKIKIYTHSGKLVKEVVINSTDTKSVSIEVGDLSSGVYLLEFNGNKSIWEKIIVQ